MTLDTGLISLSVETIVKERLLMWLRDSLLEYGLIVAKIRELRIETVLRGWFEVYVGNRWLTPYLSLLKFDLQAHHLLGQQLHALLRLLLPLLVCVPLLLSDFDFAPHFVMILAQFEVLLPLELLGIGELSVCGLQQLHLLLEEDELLRVLEGREVVRIIVDVRAQLLECALDFL